MEGDIGGEVTKEERRERGPALGQRKREGRSVWEGVGEVKGVVKVVSRRRVGAREGEMGSAKVIIAVS